MKPDYISHDGTIQMYRADCAAVWPCLPRLDLCLTDPPYGIGERLVRGGSGGSFDMLIHSGANEWDHPIEPEAVRSIFDGSRDQIIWGGNFYEMPPCKKPLCWNKLRPNQQNLSEWEYAWSSLEGRAEMFTYCANGGFVTKEKRVHPTQKPVPLMNWCLDFFPDAETVIDPYMGSGSTLVACVATGRKCIGVERDPEYFNIAVKRVEQAFADQALFVPQPVETQAEMFPEPGAKA